MEAIGDNTKKMMKNRYLELLRQSPKCDEETLELVQEDLEYGISENDISTYVLQGYDIGQMRILSQCLRENISTELTGLLKKNSLSGHQMQVALEFYKKGVSIADIETVIASGDTPFHMKSAFQSILDKLEEARKGSAGQPEYVAALVKEMEQLVEKIQFQEKRYDEMGEKLAKLAAGKDSDEIRDSLYRELESRNGIIDDQQNRLNQATATIARLREETEKKDKEIKKMGGRIDTLEERLLNTGADGRNGQDMTGAGKNGVSGTNTAQGQVKSQQPSSPQVQEQPRMQQASMQYQLPVTDGQGNFVQHVSVEHIGKRKRKSGTGIAALFAKLCFRRKSRADIVKLVASGNLVPAQLVQIRSAMERGLTEGQLVELINNNVAADKMKEIIEIAVLENSLGY